MPQDQSATYDRVALVLQGGGALGAYQAGVYQAMYEHDCVPDWVAGTSIGAINAALIAGGPVATSVARLRNFWDGLAIAEPWQSDENLGALPRTKAFYSVMQVVMFGERGFFRPRFNPLYSRTADRVSFYDTAPLRETLAELIDFDRLNNGPIRLSVGAVSVTRGDLDYFDSRHRRIEPDHIMASGALPPGFPPVRVDGELYWDGGLYSNTPVETVLDDTPRVNTLCFAINLWNHDAPEPKNLADVFAREKEIRYASRFRQQIEAHHKLHNMRRAIRKLYDALPEDVQAEQQFQRLAEHGCDTTMNVVRLGRAAHDWELAWKDVNFAGSVLRERWRSGYEDANCMFDDSPWDGEAETNAGLIVHELDRARWHTRD